MRVGIIGCGTVALQAHIPTFASLGLEIVGVADNNPKALLKIPAKKRYSDYKVLLDQNLDLISICTPPHMHQQMCIDAAQRGVNILVEKPLALTVQECIEIKKKVESNNIKFCVVHNYKFLDPILRAKKMQCDGNLGKILSMYAISHGSSPPAKNSWMLNEQESGSLVLEFIHPLYILEWFCGKPRTVYSVGKKVINGYPFIRDINALITFDDTVGILEMCQFMASPSFSLMINGTGANLGIRLPVKFRVHAPSAQLEVLEEAQASFQDIAKLFKMYLATKRPPMSFTWGSHFRLIKSYIESIESDSDPPSTLDEGIESIKLGKAIEQSMKTEKEITV